MKTAMSVLALVALAVVSYFAYQGFSTQPVEVEDQYVTVSTTGPRAPAFVLPNINGQSMALEQLSGKVVIANFWATWCSPCRTEMPTLQALQDKFSKDRVEVVAISVDDEAGTIVDYIKRNDYTFTVLWDQTKAVSNLYGVSGYPYTLVIDPNGFVVDRIAGVTDWASPDKVRMIEHLASNGRLSKDYQ